MAADKIVKNTRDEIDRTVEIMKKLIKLQREQQKTNELYKSKSIRINIIVIK